MIFNLSIYILFNRVAPPHPQTNNNNNNNNRSNIKRERISIDHRSQVKSSFRLTYF